MDSIKISIGQDENGGGTIEIQGPGLNYNFKAEYLMIHTIKSTPDSPTEASITVIEARKLKENSLFLKQLEQLGRRVTGK